MLERKVTNKVDSSTNALVFEKNARISAENCKALAE